MAKNVCVKAFGKKSKAMVAEKHIGKNAVIFGTPVPLAPLSDTTTKRSGLLLYKKYFGILAEDQTSPDTPKPTVHMPDGYVVPAGKELLWSYEFELPVMGTDIMINTFLPADVANQVTVDEFYGTLSDGSDKTIEVRWLGFPTHKDYISEGGIAEITPVDQESGKKTDPRDSNGIVNFDEGRLYWTSAALGKRSFVLNKYKKA